MVKHRRFDGSLNRTDVCMRFSEEEAPSTSYHGEAAYGLTIINLDMDDKVLDYHDTILRVRDVVILTGPTWLNDAILTFYFAYLENDKYASLRRSVSFVDASVSFLVANVAVSDVTNILEPLGLTTRRVVVFSVSNNEDVAVPEGGSHWSLLVFRKGERGGSDTFEHYDSAGGMNERAASSLAAAVAPHLGSSKAYKFVASPKGTPRQDNGHDCGLYALAVADAVCSAHALGQSGNEEEASALTRKLGKVTPEFIADFRAELLDLVEGLSSDADTGTTLDTASSLEP